MKSAIDVVQHVFVVLSASKAMAMQSRSMTILRPEDFMSKSNKVFLTSIICASLDSIWSKWVSIFLNMI